jgi:type IV pilus assembly protein PilB
MTAVSSPRRKHDDDYKEDGSLTSFGLAELRWVPLGSLLTSAGLLTDEQLNVALELGKKTNRRLGEIIVELGYLTEKEIARALAEQYKLDYVELEHVAPESDVVALLPEELARRYRALPIKRLDGNTLLLAIADPTDLVAADDLSLALGSNVRMAVADPQQLELAITRAHRRKIEVAPEPEAPETAPDIAQDIRDPDATQPTINLVNSLLTNAIDDGASDLHFEPRRKDMLVRARIDGVMREVATIPKQMMPGVTSRLKIMGSLDIAERRSPQDGRVSVNFGGDPIDLRIAVMPTTHGEQVVLRLAQRRERPPTLAELGMTPAVEEIFRRAIAQPYGAVIVCGPTGSGKTTTLYAALGVVNDPDRVLMTIEDPVEHQLDGVIQIEVDPKARLTFARGLRTILRSDPDVLLVGEIRDEETAAVGIQAAMTGHLVLTSLHAHDAARAIARLREMGVPAGLLASSINCIVAQRLARRLCLQCRAPRTVPTSIFGDLAPVGVESVTVYDAQGCPACSHTGHKGRIAVHELMPIDSDVRALMESSTEEVYNAAVRNGMIPLHADGLRLCLEGICSLAEIARVTGDRFDD